MPNCMVPSCPNNSCRKPVNGISYYRLPKSPNIRKKWLQDCNKEDGQVKDSLYILFIYYNSQK